MLRAAAEINGRYGSGTVEVEIKDSYRNMAEQIRPHWHLIENAYEAVREVGANPRANQCGRHRRSPAVFYGTALSKLGYRQSQSSQYLEYASVQAMDQCTAVLVKLAQKYAYFTP